MSNGHDAGRPATIFVDNCDRYWEAGLPVMPLRAYSPDGGRDGKPTGKEPVVLNWQALQSRMPTEAEKASWKVFHRNGNIGLPLGPASGLVAIDIDTDDEKLIDVILKVLPPSPWKRVGQKGMVLVYKYDGQPIIRLKYRGEDGKTHSIVEMLGAGSQIVLPPSIHPKTAQPYTANYDLVDVLGKVQSLPANIEQRLRDALSKAGLTMNSKGFGSVTNYISSGNRDNQLVAMAGLFARNVLRGEKTLLEACNEIEVAITTFMQRVYGDDIDPAKGPQKLIEFLIRDVTGPKGKSLPKGWDEGLSAEQKEQWGLDQFSEDNENWDAPQLRAYFDAHLEKTGVKDNPEQFMGLVKRVLAKVANNQSLDAIEEDNLIRHLISCSSSSAGTKLSVGALRKQLKDLRAGPIAGSNHTEIAKAVINDLQETGGEIRYYAEKLWQWNGSHWAEMNDGLIKKYVAEEYGQCKAASKAQDHAGIVRTICCITQSDLTKKSVLGINFVNGFLTEDLDLIEHNPDHGITYTLPYPYLPEKAGKCPRWQKMLVDYWGEDPDFAEKVTALGEAMAMTLFGKMTETQRAVCLYGVAHSGKSQIMEIVQGLMPPEAQTSLSPDQWGERFGPAMLVGKSLNFAGELSERKFIDGAKFKQIVSGEMIEAQEKNKSPFTFRPKAAHWFASNHLPKSHDSSDGFTRRWLFLVFKKPFPQSGSKVNNFHKVIITEEREAITAWAVQHMVRLRNEQFQLTEPASSIKQCGDLGNELNPVQDFLLEFSSSGKMLIGKEACKKLNDNNNFTLLKTFYDEYRIFCPQQGLPPLNWPQLKQRIKQLEAKFGFQFERVDTASGSQVEVIRDLVFLKSDSGPSPRKVHANR